MGHWSASQSLCEQLGADGHTVMLMDFFDYALPELAPAMYRGFNFLVTHMGSIYNLFHRMTRDVEGEVLLASTELSGELPTDAAVWLRLL